MAVPLFCRDCCSLVRCVRIVGWLVAGRWARGVGLRGGTGGVGRGAGAEEGGHLPQRRRVLRARRSHQSRSRELQSEGNRGRRFPRHAGGDREGRKLGAIGVVSHQARRQGQDEVAECEPPVRPRPTRKGPSFPPPPPPPKKDPNGLETVVLELDGKAHDLQVGYVAETPVWRPSYRLVIDKGGSDLQAWGIVQNLSGEDWKGVTLSLIAGAPLAFEAKLGSAHHSHAPDRDRHGRGHRQRSAKRDEPQPRADGAAARRASGSVGRSGRRAASLSELEDEGNDSAPRKKGEAKKDAARKVRPALAAK